MISFGLDSINLEYIHIKDSWGQGIQFNQARNTFSDVSGGLASYKLVEISRLSSQTAQCEFYGAAWKDLVV